VKIMTGAARQAETPRRGGIDATTIDVEDYFQVEAARPAKSGNLTVSS